MIVLDIETTGLDERKHGIIEIGAIKLEDPREYFHIVCRIDEDEEIDPNALKVNGQTEDQVKDYNRPSQKQALMQFFEWIEKQKDFYVAGEVVGTFDLRFLLEKSRKHHLDYPFQKRTFELNTAASLKFEEVRGTLPIVDGNNEISLSSILLFVGMEDIRKAHNALEDAKLEGEAISRIRFGKNLFKEYEKYPIPDYLKKTV